MCNNQKPCDATCPKCGSADTSMGFFKAETSRDRAFLDRRRRYEPSPLIDDSGTFTTMFLKDCLSIICRRCQYGWVMEPLKREENPKEADKSVAAGDAAFRSLYVCPKSAAGECGEICPHRDPHEHRFGCDKTSVECPQCERVVASEAKEEPAQPELVTCSHAALCREQHCPHNGAHKWNGQCSLWCQLTGRDVRCVPIPANKPKKGASDNHQQPRPASRQRSARKVPRDQNK